jgi:AraC-like DNA-binding protein
MATGSSPRQQRPTVPPCPQRPAARPGPPVDVELARLERVAVGRFRCPVDHPSFADSGPIRGTLIVFPRVPVWIQHAGGPALVADANVAMLYNNGQEYRRTAISHEGDRCEWFSFEPELVAEALAVREPAALERRERPFRQVRVAVDATTYALQRALFDAATNGAAPSSPPLDPLWMEETALQVLGRVVAGLPPPSPGSARWSPASRARTRDEHAGLVAELQHLLGTRLDARWSLGDLGRTLGRSPFHLGRVFARATGTTLHAYRHQLRLRAALERISDGVDLTTVALDLGFSSHSHFTSAFTRAFGGPPSGFRLARRRRSQSAGGDPGRILKAR